MGSTCLISSSLNEIEMFKNMHLNIKYIISDIEGYVQPMYDLISKVFETADLCIIGETISYSDPFIEKLIHLGAEHHVEIINYHIADRKSAVIQKIRVPVVFVSSLLPDMGKSAIGLRIVRALEQRGYKPLLISSNPLWQMFGCVTFPFEVIASPNPVLALNNFIKKKASEADCDVLVLCVPGGIISSPKYNMYCDYGLLDVIVSRAVSPCYILNCVHQNTENLGFIPQPFPPFKINRHIRTDRILDQNEYDGYEKMLNMTVTDEMANDDGELNVFDSVVYDAIAKEIDPLINKEAKNNE